MVPDRLVDRGRKVVLQTWIGEQWSALLLIEPFRWHQYVHSVTDKTQTILQTKEGKYLSHAKDSHCMGSVGLSFHVACHIFSASCHNSSSSFSNTGH